MRMARAANAACLLVGDIDRGGVFASLLGTLELLEPSERALIRGYALNKFRGDISLLRPGLTMIEPRLGIPCAGVVPYLHDLGLDEEDGVAVEDRRSAGRVWKDLASGASRERPLRIGVVALPHMSNFTDFDALAAEPSVALAFVDRPEDLSGADLVILPGTKQTLNDLKWLHERGLAPLLLGHPARGGCVAGICGGFQMLGIQIEDPQGIENGGLPCARQGLGLLRVRTVLESEKITRPASGRLLSPAIFGQHANECAFRGYEIHVGKTVYAEEATPFAEIARTGSSAVVTDGAVSVDRRVLLATLVISVVTTVLFGILPALRASGTSPAGVLKGESGSVTGSARKARLSAGLVVAQIAFSLLLLVSAGLFIRSLRAAHRSA